MASSTFLYSKKICKVRQGTFVCLLVNILQGDPDKNDIRHTPVLIKLNMILVISSLIIGNYF